MWLRRCMTFGVIIIVLADAFLTIYFNGTSRWDPEVRNGVLWTIGFCFWVAVMFFAAALYGLRDPEGIIISKAAEPLGGGG